MSTSITFHGAARTVTGSRHLLDLDGHKVLVDCGLFQGPETIRRKNWDVLGFEPHEIEAIVVTHAHLDHIGFLPRLVQLGFDGPIYATRATIGLAKISLPDSARLQEEEARFWNRHNPERHRDPLYTEEDVFRTTKLFEALDYHALNPLPGRATFRFEPAGHILGSAFAEIFFASGERILMSGDLGRPNTPIIRDPTPMTFAEYLVIESTYGDRVHPQESAGAYLEEILAEAYRLQGPVIFPSFAIGRTQELLYLLAILEDAGRLPPMPIFVDSPMAVSSSEIYERCVEEHDEDMLLRDPRGFEPRSVTLVRDLSQSKVLNQRVGPMVVISGSGMANGGRVVHHLMHHLPDPNAVVVFTGFQVAGTLGRALIDGAPEVTIHGAPVPVRARVTSLQSLSAHADSNEMMAWLGNFQSPPKRTFIVHGEPPAQDALRARIERELGWQVEVPEQGQAFAL